mmetsp:Transcript_44379/g.77995  ORF Transcript_44379/g.77995 Transcript_44379/m.77995 type:complete len:293 (+) Transcript_44379:347-1225(+)
MGPSSEAAADEDVFRPLITDLESTFAREPATEAFGLLPTLLASFCEPASSRFPAFRSSLVRVSALPSRLDDPSALPSRLDDPPTLLSRFDDPPLPDMTELSAVAAAEFVGAFVERVDFRSPERRLLLPRPLAPAAARGPKTLAADEFRFVFTESVDLRSDDLSRGFLSAGALAGACGSFSRSTGFCGSFSWSTGCCGSFSLSTGCTGGAAAARAAGGDFDLSAGFCVSLAGVSESLAGADGGGVCACSMKPSVAAADDCMTIDCESTDLVAPLDPIFSVPDCRGCAEDTMAD